MALVEWNPALAVGIPEIDYQHNNLLLLINNLHAAIERGDSKPLLGVVLDELDLYVATHFDSEERLMARIDYPLLAEHREEHRRLTESVHDYREAYERGTGGAEDLLQFLLRWLLNHIVSADTHIGQVYAEKWRPAAGG